MSRRQFLPTGATAPSLAAAFRPERVEPAARLQPVAGKLDQIVAG